LPPETSRGPRCGDARATNLVASAHDRVQPDDAGRTWTHIGLDLTRQIGRVLIDPKNPDVVFVAAPGPVTLEILDRAGDVVRRYSSEERPTPVDPNTLNVQAIWRPTPEPLPAAAGIHRWVWDLRPTPAPSDGRGGGPGGALVLPGAYTVRLAVGGKSYTQPLRVKMDPRVH
jgi:hypothetical protein